MMRCIYHASQINRVGFWSEARWLRGLWRAIFGLLGDFRAGTLWNSMFRKSPEHLRFDRLQAVPFWSAERVRSQCTETGPRRHKREETGGEAGRKGTALLTVTTTFEFPIAPATEN